MEDLRSTNTLTVQIPAPAETQKRCGAGSCKKRLLLTDVACRCGYKFCAAHRHAEEHDCMFDYKTAAIATLSTSLVKCVAPKLASGL